MQSSSLFQTLSHLFGVVFASLTLPSPHIRVFVFVYSLGIHLRPLQIQPHTGRCCVDGGTLVSNPCVSQLHSCLVSSLYHITRQTLPSLPVCQGDYRRRPGHFLLDFTSILSPVIKRRRRRTGTVAGWSRAMKRASQVLNRTPAAAAAAGRVFCGTMYVFRSVPKPE